MEGDALIVFIGASAAVAASLWLLFSKPSIPIPEAMPRGLARLLLESVDDWLRLFGGWFACACLPVALMLALGALEGGMQFWHWPAAVVIFAVLAVWRLR